MVWQAMGRHQPTPLSEKRTFFTSRNWPHHTLAYTLHGCPWRSANVLIQKGFLVLVANSLAWHRRTKTCSANRPAGLPSCAAVRGPAYVELGIPQPLRHSFSFYSPLRVSRPAAFCELLSEVTQHSQVRRCPIWSHQFGKRALGFPGGMEEAKVALDKYNSEGPQTSSIERCLFLLLSKRVRRGSKNQTWHQGEDGSQL